MKKADKWIIGKTELYHGSPHSWLSVINSPFLPQRQPYKCLLGCAETMGLTQISCCLVAKSSLILCNPKNRSLPGSSVHWVLVIKNLPANGGEPETWVWFLGWEDPLEKGIATHSSILAWKMQWTGETGGLQSRRLTTHGGGWWWCRKHPYFLHPQTACFTEIICFP